MPIEPVPPRIGTVDEDQASPAPATGLLAQPGVLLFTTRRWYSAARLAIAFHESGLRVELLSPPRHPASLTGRIVAHHSFRALSPLRSILAAVRSSQPGLIVPTDDTATGYLHQLFDSADQMDPASAGAVRSLLERSLGDPASFSTLASRSALLAAAQQEGVLTAPTQIVPDLPALRAWLAQHPLPAVLKADGTSGGEGVEIVTTEKQAIRVWRKLHSPLGFLRTAKKAAVEHDANHIVPWLTRRPRQVSIQQFIKGHDANLAVACWQGEVLGIVAADVRRTWRFKGPAVLVEIIQNDPMADAAVALVRRLRLSGFCGFDFILENPHQGQSSAAPPRAWLIELNPRATQTCHLPFGTPHDLVPAISAVLSSRPIPPQERHRPRGLVALFPLAWKAGISPEVLDSSIQDVPWQAPALVDAGFAMPPESLYEKCRKWWLNGSATIPIAGEGK